MPIINIQKKLILNLQRFRKFLDTAEDRVSEFSKRSATVAFVSDRKMRQLNKQFRDRSSTTDVLSFPHEPDEFDTDTNNLGDIVISVQQAERQAKENCLTLENEIKQLILHGLLHLCGYNHETDNGEMNKRELELRDKLGI